MKTKKTFIQYTDYYDKFSRLNDEQLGQLYRSILTYQKGLPVKIDDPLTAALFDVVKVDMDNEKKKYQEKCEKNQEIAKKRELKKRTRTCTNVHERAKQAPNENENENENDINNLFKNKLSKTTLFEVEEIEKKPKEDKRKQEVNFVLDFFKEKAGFYPIDQKPRFVANNFFRKVNSRWKKARGCDIPFDAFESLTKEYFNWYFKENDRVETKRLQTVYKNLEVYLSKLGRQNGRKTY